MLGAVTQPSCFHFTKGPQSGNMEGPLSGSLTYLLYYLTIDLTIYLTIDLTIDPLHDDVTFGYFRIRTFGRHHIGGQKCIAVIERKVLIVSLLTNASDY